MYRSSFPAKIYHNFCVFIHNCDLISHKLDLVFNIVQYLEQSDLIYLNFSQL